VACHFALVEEMRSVTRVEERCAEQKVAMWTGINLLHSVESVANHQQAGVGSEASWPQAEVGSGADCWTE